MTAKNRATGVWEPAAAKINHSPQYETTGGTSNSFCRGWMESTKPRFRPSELLHLAAFESRIAAVAAGDIANGRILSDDDYRRVSIAAEVLDAIVREACRYGR